MIFSAQTDHTGFTAETGGGAVVDGNVNSDGDFSGRDTVKAEGGKVNVVVHSSAQDVSLRFMMLGIIGIITVGLIFVTLFFTTPAPANQDKLPLNHTPVAAPAVVEDKPLQEILFEYSDEPTNHGWKLTESKSIYYTHPVDGYNGAVLAITSTTKYALSFIVKPEARAGKQIKATIKLEKDASFYVLTELLSKQGSATKKMWFKFKDGTPAMKPVAGKDDEWQIIVETEHVEGGWQKFHIDLVDIIEKTVGKDGWRLGQLNGFRVRGNLSLASIVIYPQEISASSS